MIPAAEGEGAMARLSLRIDLGTAGALGPGKVALLERIDEHGSISAAARAMGMSYRRAWLLVEAVNGAFREPAVAARPGGPAGGGAALTPFGADLVRRYRAIEAAAHVAASDDLHALQAAAAE
jgi:molybdate transport system regulatory protein